MKSNITYLHARHTVETLRDGYNVKGEKIPTQRVINTRIFVSAHDIKERGLELSPKGGVTFAIIKTPTQVFVRTTRCHPKDNYCKKEGRKRAVRKVNRLITTREHWDTLCKQFGDNYSRIRQLSSEVAEEELRLTRKESSSSSSPPQKEQTRSFAPPASAVQ